MNKKLSLLLYILAFIEGGAVMCVELCSAKILTPFFGTSIYVWAAVLGITLTALMSGYYLGGYISAKNQKKNTIYWLMLIGGFLVTITPIISNTILPITINYSLITGSIISLICFLFFPLMLFGATSPLLINYLTMDAKKSGKSSGTVYAVSTLGGIITTFIVGFYTLPEFGITKTLYAYGILVMGISCYLFVATRNFKVPVSIILLLGLLSLNFHNKSYKEQTHYFSEGILGEVKVLDQTFFNTRENKTSTYRQLIVNNISQTIMDIQHPEKSYWDYVDVLSYNLNAYKKGNQALLLGLGGGTLYKKLKSEGLSTDVVELDKRIGDVAKEFFFIEDDINLIIDDARHYIKTTHNKYDVIIYDLFQAETPPIHIMTKEAFNEIKTRLNENGILIINFYGFIAGERGKAARSIYKTLLNEKYNIRLFATSNDEASRNLIFVCSTEELKANKQLIHSMLYEMDLDLNDAEVLKDDIPKLNHLYVKAALKWRQDYNEINAKQFLRH